MIGKILGGISSLITLWIITSLVFGLTANAKEIECYTDVIGSIQDDYSKYSKIAIDECVDDVHNSWSKKYGESFYPNFTDKAFGWIDELFERE